MARRIKKLGLAAIAVLALTAVAANAAQATTFTAATYPATITGEQTAKHVFHTTAGSIKCETATFAGVKTLGAASETFEMAPTYEKCFLGGTDPVTITMNSCTYNFHAAASGSATGKVDVVCPSGKHIEIDIGQISGCHIDVPAQTGLGNLTYTNNATGNDINVNINVTGIKYQLTGAAEACVASQKEANETRTDGTYTGEATVKGTNSGVADKIDVG
jgi:hypothetical protein